MPSRPETALPPGTLYEVVAADVAIEVYRDGPLAELGHNHVIGTSSLKGRIELREPPSRSSFVLTLPADALMVDEPHRRVAAGPAFPDSLSAEDKEATRRNMLSRALLDAASFPLIELDGVGSADQGGGLSARTRVTVAGSTSEILVPVTAEVVRDRLHASGTLTLTHASLGLTPFAALMGALKVREDMKVTWRIEARRIPSSS